MFGSKTSDAPVELFGGPMDGETVERKSIQGGILKTPIRKRMARYPNWGDLAFQVWGFAMDNMAEAVVTYELSADGLRLNYVTMGPV